MKIQKLLEFDIHTERQFLKLDKLNPDQVMQWLEDNNFDKIGEGHFSNVYAKKQGNRVIKIIMGKDKAYLDFIRLALNNTNNPHLPKVYWINHYSQNDFYAKIR